MVLVWNANLYESVSLSQETKSQLPKRMIQCHDGKVLEVMALLEKLNFALMAFPFGRLHSDANALESSRLGSMNSKVGVYVLRSGGSPFQGEVEVYLIRFRIRL